MEVHRPAPSQTKWRAGLGSPGCRVKSTSSCVFWDGFIVVLEVIWTPVMTPELVVLCYGKQHSGEKAALPVREPGHEGSMMHSGDFAQRTTAVLQQEKNTQPGWGTRTAVKIKAWVQRYTSRDRNGKFELNWFTMWAWRIKGSVQIQRGCFIILWLIISHETNKEKKAVKTSKPASQMF